jgi:hypothetical protein
MPSTTILQFLQSKPKVVASRKHSKERALMAANAGIHYAKMRQMDAQRLERAQIKLSQKHYQSAIGDLYLISSKVLFFAKNEALLQCHFALEQFKYIRPLLLSEQTPCRLRQSFTEVFADYFIRQIMKLGTPKNRQEVCEWEKKAAQLERQLSLFS